jgi:hypothetical protein
VRAGSGAAWATPPNAKTPEHISAQALTLAIWRTGTTSASAPGRRPWIGVADRSDGAPDQFAAPFG